MTSWTPVRLQWLFLHYRKKYWKGRLPDFSVLIDNSLDACGDILFRRKQIRVNVRQHESDASIRATLLHEMAHLAAGKVGHDSPFFSQIETLLRRKAPIQIGLPENEDRKWLHVVPTRFRLLRKRLNQTYARRQRSIERRIKHSKLPVENLTPESLEQEVKDAAAIEGLTWKQIFVVIAERDGLVDADGKPLTWAKPYIEAAKRGYRRGSRAYLIEKELERKCGFNVPEETENLGQSQKDSPEKSAQRLHFNCGSANPRTL